MSLHIDLISPRGGPIAVSRSQFLSGNEATTALWAVELARRGHDVKVYSPLATREEAEGVTWSPLAAYRGSLPDTVAIAFRDLEVLRDLPRSVTSILFLGDRPAAGVDALSSIHCDAVWLNSVAHWTMFRPYLKALQKIHIGCCGYDESIFRPGPDVVRPRFFNAAAPYRSLKNLLRLWPRIRQEIPDAELHLTGGYELWGYSAEQSRDLLERDVLHSERGVAGVHMHGVLTRNEYSDLLKTCAFYLYPTSYQETCCIAVLEAAASGVVPIVSDVAALNERVIHTVTGILVPDTPDWADAFSNYAVELARDQDLRRVLSARSARYASLDTASRVIDELESLIYSLKH